MNILKLLKKSLILTVITGFVPLCVIFIGQQVNAISYASNVNVDDLYSLSNQERSNAGLAALTPNEQLKDAASAKANHTYDY